MSPFVRQIVLAAALSAQCSFDLAVIPVVHFLKLGELSPMIVLGMYGMLFGQVTMLALYLAWGSESFLFKFPKSVLFIVGLWAAITLGALSTEDSFEVASIGELFAIITTTSFVCVSIPVWGMRFTLGSRLESAVDHAKGLGITCEWGEANSHDLGDLTAVESKFGQPTINRPHSRIVGGLIWASSTATLITALTSSLLRKIWTERWSFSGSDWMEIPLWVSIEAFLCLLVALPVTWGLLHRQPTTLRFWIVALIVMVIIAIEYATFSRLPAVQRFSEWLVGFNLGILLEVVCWSFLLRSCGYQLQLLPRQSPSAPMI